MIYILWPDQDWGSSWLAGDAGDAGEGPQFASVLASSPIHRAPVSAHGEERPRLGLQAPSCLLGCICTISLKNQLSPLSASPRKRFWQSMEVLCTRSVKWKKFPGKQLWPKPLSVNLGYALLIWKQEKRNAILFPLNFFYLAWHAICQFRPPIKQTCLGRKDSLMTRNSRNSWSKNAL